MKALFFIFCISFPIGLIAQMNNRVALGLDAGYGLYSSSINIDYNFLKKLSLTCQIGDGKFVGFGFGGALTYYMLPENDIRPLFGVAFNRSFGGYTSYGDGNTQYTVFKIKDADYTVPFIGCRMNGLAKNPFLGLNFSLLLKFGFKISTNISPGLRLDSGPADNGKYDEINKRINNGLIVAVGFIINFIPKG